jgi:hypothetical protein
MTAHTLQVDNRRPFIDTLTVLSLSRRSRQHRDVEMILNHPEGTVYLLFLMTDNETRVPDNGKRFWEIPVPLPETPHWLFLTTKPLDCPPDFEVCDIMHREVRMVGNGNRVAVFRRWNYAQEEGVQYKPRNVSRKLQSLEIEDYRIIMSALDEWMGGSKFSVRLQHILNTSLAEKEKRTR